MDCSDLASIDWSLLNAAVAWFLSGATAAAQDAASPSVDSSQLDALISKWVEDHPDLILKSINEHMAKQQPNLVDFIASADELVASPRPSIGAPADRAEIVLVEFSDFNCRYCRESEPVVHAKLAEDATIRVIYRDLAFLVPSSETAALAARAADIQGKYMAYREALFGRQKET